MTQNRERFERYERDCGQGSRGSRGSKRTLHVAVRGRDRSRSLSRPTGCSRVPASSWPVRPSSRCPRVSRSRCRSVPSRSPRRRSRSWSSARRWVPDLVPRPSRSISSSPSMIVSAHANADGRSGGGEVPSGGGPLVRWSRSCRARQRESGATSRTKRPARPVIVVPWTPGPSRERAAIATSSTPRTSGSRRGDRICARRSRSRRWRSRR